MNQRQTFPGETPYLRCSARLRADGAKQTSGGRVGSELLQR